MAKKNKNKRNERTNIFIVLCDCEFAAAAVTYEAAERYIEHDIMILEETRPEVVDCVSYSIVEVPLYALVNPTR